MVSHPLGSRRSQRGGTLIVALVTMAVAVTLACSALSIATVERKDLARTQAEVAARALSEAGVHRALSFVRDTLRLDPFQPLEQLDRVLTNDGTTTSFTVSADEALVRNGRQHGTFTTAVTIAPNGGGRDLTVTSTGYFPDAVNPRAKQTTRAVVRVELAPGRVFDYSYFINNWGWFYGDTIYAQGNVRSNAQFDAAGYQPGVYGTPRYESLDLSDPTHPLLVGYQDDNEDSVMDGSDGGIYAGWDIVGADNVQGMGGLAQNQHEFVDQVPMPNLNDLTVYEAQAKDNGSSLSIGNGVGPPTPICDAVLGDESGEKQNLVLIGTSANPILLNGPVVVRGDLIIKGVVSGQGAIYASGNIYVADNLTYLNPPTTWTPANETQATTEAWMAANQAKDFCGLFAKEHLVLGNFKDSWWRAYVGWWLGHSMNKSAEDSGADLIPDTHLGRDGIADTEDDDVLEGDGVWTVELYTAEDALLGRIPAGRNVGDPIPGSGEDIDGDGVYDPTVTLTEFDLNATLNTTNWAGNLPAGVTDFAQLSTTAMTSIHAALYTNHAAALLTLAWGQDFRFFGSIVSRNESLIYGTNTMNLTYDRRLSASSVFGDMLPRTVAPLTILAWQILDNDVRPSLETQP